MADQCRIWVINGSRPTLAARLLRRSHLERGIAEYDLERAQGDAARPGWRRNQRHISLIGVAVGPAIFDRDVLAVDEGGFIEALVERAQTFGGLFSRRGVQKSDQRPLVSARGQRPSCGA
jgi:hypothetical protein